MPEAKSALKNLAPRCPYCGEGATITTGETVYPHRPDLYEKNFWVCVPCDARVGCHSGTMAPLGSLANAELRSWRLKAHGRFDTLWRRRNERLSRSRAYAWLAERLQLSPAECHIGMMSLDQCKAVVEAVDGGTWRDWARRNS